jgi:CHASE2 domain-containing sensor protein
VTHALRVRMLAAVALLAAAAAGAITLTGAAREAELDTVGARFALRGERPPGEVVVVGIDDVTFDAFDERWPFSRNRHADVIEKLAADRPRVIVYDVQFTEPSGDARADNRLIRAARAAGNVVFRTTEVGDHGESNVFGGAEALAFARATAGNGLLPEGAGGALRRIPERVDGLDTLAVAAVKRIDRPVPVERLGGEGAWIEYAGPPGHVAHEHFSDVAAGAVPTGRFRDKLVVVGATAPALQDLHPVSWPGGEMDGPEIHANAIATLLAGAPLRATGRGVDLLLAVALAVSRRCWRCCCGRGPGCSPRSPAARCTRSPRSCCSTRAGSSRWWRRSRGSRSGSPARWWCTGSARRSSARARAPCSRASCPTPSTRCSRAAPRRAARGSAASGSTRPCCSATCAGSRRSPRHATPSR